MLHWKIEELVQNSRKEQKISILPSGVFPGTQVYPYAYLPYALALYHVSPKIRQVLHYSSVKNIVPGLLLEGRHIFILIKTNL